MRKQFVLLAKSWWDGGLCVAGRQLSDISVIGGSVNRSRPGAWLRPVSEAGGPLTSGDLVLEQGQTAKLLDVIDIGVANPAPAGHKQENWTADGSRAVLVGRLPVSSVPQFCETPHLLWGQGASTRLGLNDCVTQDYVAHCRTSLVFVEMSDLHIVVDWSSSGRRGCWGDFHYGGTEYRLRITDPQCAGDLSRRHTGEYAGPRGHVYGCISLTDVYKDHRHHKLIASLITPEDNSWPA